MRGVPRIIDGPWPPGPGTEHPPGVPEGCPRIDAFRRPPAAARRSDSALAGGELLELLLLLLEEGVLRRLVPRVEREADIDARLMMLWKVRLRLGHFDPVGPLDLIKPATTICTEEAIATSMQGTIQSAALLKNANQTLPLLVGAGAGKVAVILTD